MASAGLAALRRDVKKLRELVAERTQAAASGLLRVNLPPPEVPLTQTEVAAAEIERRWPAMVLIEVRFYGHAEMERVTPLSRRPRPFEIARHQLITAINADVSAWLGSVEHRTWLAAQVREHVERVWSAGSEGRRCWIDALQDFRAACGQYGFPFPDEAESIVRGDWTSFAAQRGALQIGSHFVESPSTATIAMEPIRPEQQQAMSVRMDGAVTRVVAAPGTCRVCGSRHTASEVRCTGCGCPALHHQSVLGAWLCRYCSHPPAAHWNTAAAPAVYQRGRLPPCRQYEPCLLDNASDHCECGRCPRIYVEPAGASPTVRNPVQEAPR